MKKLLIRTISGLVYAAVIVGGLLVNKYCFLAFVLVFSVLMMMEFQNMSLGKKYPWQQALAIIAGVTLVTLAFCEQAFGINALYLTSFFIAVFLLCASILFLRDRSELLKLATLFVSIIYIAVPMAIFNLAAFKAGEFSGMLLLCLFILVWMSDVGAYAFGMAIGQKYGHKMCPDISPHKTWTGAIGGLVFTVGVAIALHYAGWLPFSILHCIALGVVVDVAGVCGDLIESVWKRFYGLKDSGNLIPGHGGLLDRFDSSLMAIPMGVIYLIIANLC